MKGPMIILWIVSALLLSGCSTQCDDKPRAVGLQMQSNALAGSLQYGLKF